MFAEPRPNSANSSASHPWVERWSSWGLRVGVVYGWITSLALTCGCAPRVSTSTSKADNSASAEKENLPVTFPNLVRKNSDTVSVRTALQQMNAYFSDDPNSPLKSLDAARLAQLRQRLQLTDEEANEVARPDYSPLDAYYLAQALTVYEGMRSLELAHDPPPLRAQRAFAWAMRMVALEPENALPAPPMFAIRRGYGSGLDRAYVALAAFQQAGFDGLLIGPSDCENRPSYSRTANEAVSVVPFWAVGAFAEGQVYLFDPWNGRPFAGPKGQGIATLAQVRSDPALVASWGQQVSPVLTDPAKQIADSQAFFAPMLSALALRMQYLDQVLRLANPGIRLYVDPNRITEALTQANVPFRWWAPSNDPMSATRILSSFLSPEEGGTDRPQGNFPRRYDLFRRLLVPDSMYPQELANVGGQIGDRLRLAYAKPFEMLVLAPTSPRDSIARGEFREAIQMLTQIQDESRKLLNRVRLEKTLAAETQQWLQEAQAATAKLARAQSQRDLNAEQQARVELDAIYARSEKVMLTLQSGIQEALLADVVFLQALCKHEEAERLHARWERASTEAKPTLTEPARKAWTNCQSLWNNYLGEYPRRYPQFAWRNQHAQRLAQRTTEALEQLKP